MAPTSPASSRPPSTTAKASRADWYNKIMPVKVLDSTGAGSTYSVARRHHLGSRQRRQSHQHEPRQLRRSRNSCTMPSNTPMTRTSSSSRPAATTTPNRPGYPAAYPEVFAVASTNADGNALAVLQLRRLHRRRRAGHDHRQHVSRQPVRRAVRHVDGQSPRRRARRADHAPSIPDLPMTKSWTSCADRPGPRRQRQRHVLRLRPNRYRPRAVGRRQIGNVSLQQFPQQVERRLERIARK